MRTRPAAITILIVFLVLGGPVLSAAKQGKHKKAAGEKARQALPEAQGFFTEHDRGLVKNWFRNHRTSLPPGLAKRQQLPPGLEKQLRERGTLPPGLQKKLQPLPVELERELQPLPTGYRRAVIGDSVVVMNQKTAVIQDVIRNVIP